MKDIDFEAPSNRAGEQFRSNPDRYYHVMTEGWYIFTREGIRGPFYDKSIAANFLQQHIQGAHEEPDPSNSWRL